MKEITFSVPADSFPAQAGDHVRMSIKGITGLDMMDVLVLTVEDGCGAADRVTVRYDETLLPGVLTALNMCNLKGFQKLCEWCPIHQCFEVFAPETDVVEGTHHVTFFPSSFKLEQIKIYSVTPLSDPIIFMVRVEGEPLFPHNFTFDGTNPFEVNRTAFEAAFASGEIEVGTQIEIEIISAPGLYDPPWKGLTVCFLGQWLP